MPLERAGSPPSPPVTAFTSNKDLIPGPATRGANAYARAAPGSSELVTDPCPERVRDEIHGPAGGRPVQVNAAPAVGSALTVVRVRVARVVAEHEGGQDDDD